MTGAADRVSHVVDRVTRDVQDRVAGSVAQSRARSPPCAQGSRGPSRGPGPGRRLPAGRDRRADRVGAPSFGRGRAAARRLAGPHAIAPRRNLSPARPIEPTSHQRSRGSSDQATPRSASSAVACVASYAQGCRSNPGTRAAIPIAPDRAGRERARACPLRDGTTGASCPTCARRSRVTSNAESGAVVGEVIRCVAALPRRGSRAMASTTQSTGTIVDGIPAGPDAEERQGEGPCRSPPSRR